MGAVNQKWVWFAKNFPARYLLSKILDPPLTSHKLPKGGKRPLALRIKVLHQWAHFICVGLWSVESVYYRIVQAHSQQHLLCWETARVELYGIASNFMFILEDQCQTPVCVKCQNES